MKLRTLILLLTTHLGVGAAGFGLGIYALPILIAPPSPSETDLQVMSSQVQYSGNFKKNLKDSDALHWGEGKVSLGSGFITFKGKLAPGPDYKLYLSKEFVETESEFNRLKPTMVRVGEVKTFDNFIVEFSQDIDPAQFNTVIVWCETFGEFISSAQYQQ